VGVADWQPKLSARRGRGGLKKRLTAENWWRTENDARVKTTADSLRADTPSRLRKARRLPPALSATDATARQVVKPLLDAPASLIYQCPKHEITDSATHQKIAQVVLANVDGEPVEPASSKPFAPLGFASPLKRLGEDARKSIKAQQLLLRLYALGRIYGRNRFNSFNNWDGLPLGLGPYMGAV
jgi:hypothetical protein